MICWLMTKTVYFYENLLKIIDGLFQFRLTKIHSCHMLHLWSLQEEEGRTLSADLCVEHLF